MTRSTTTVRAKRRNLLKLLLRLREQAAHASTRKKHRLNQAAQRIVCWMMSKYGQRVRNVPREQMEKEVCNGVRLDIQCALHLSDERMKSVERVLIDYLYS